MSVVSSDDGRDVAVMEFIVILEVRAGGAPCGSTEDVVEADSGELAEEQAIKAWRVARPDRTFHPLLTLATSTEGDVA